MSNFPNLSDGKPLRQTTKRSLNIPVQIFRFLSMKEQRFVNSTPTYSFQGDYGDLSAVDYAGGGTTHSLQDFYDSMTGEAGQYTLTFNSNSYGNMYWNADRLQFQELSYNLYSTSVTLKGFPNTSFPTITVSDPALPTLGNGTTGPQNQYPNPLYHLFSNSLVDLDQTARYVYSRISTPLKGGVLMFQAITDAEVAIFEAFFIQMAGQYGIFSLNYNGVAMHCRFDTPSFTVDYSSSPNCNKVILPWLEVPM